MPRSPRLWYSARRRWAARWLPGDARSSRAQRRTPHPLRLESLESREMFALLLTAQEQLLLELVNRARANPAAEAARYGIELNQDLEPGTITADPKTALAPNEILAQAAVLHAQDMLNFNYFAHDNLLGESPSDRAEKLGYIGGVGENIAWYGSERSIDQNFQVYARHEALFLSKGHRVNMLTAQYRELGTGVRYGKYDGLLSIMVAAEFGARAGTQFITGVAYTDQVTPDNFYSIGEGIPNVTITATNEKTNQVYTTQTAAAGGYGLQVPNGTYRVTATGGGLPAQIQYVHVPIAAENFKLDFNPRNLNPGNLQGIVYFDNNRSTTADSGDTPAGDASVFIDLDGDGVLDFVEPSTKVGSDGIYHFTGLAPGRYKISVVPPSGYHLASSLTQARSVVAFANTTLTGPEFPLQELQGLPTLTSDTVAIAAGASTMIDVLNNDTDPDGTLDRSTLTITVAPTHGTARVDAGVIRYTAGSNFTGTDQLTYRVADNQGQTATATLTVTVNPIKPWQNPANAHDINADGAVSPQDAVLVLLDLNLNRARQLPSPQAGVSAPPPYVDTNGDGYVSPMDVMLVIIELNRLNQLAAAGHRASTAVTSPPPPSGESPEELPALTPPVPRIASSLADLAFALFATEPRPTPRASD